MKTVPIRPWPWPFPQWDGTRWVMPLEQAPKESRKPAQPDWSDVEENLL